MKYKKLIYGILLASLAVNFFLAGAILTHLAREKGRPFGPVERFNMEAAKDAVDPEYQAVIENILKDVRRDQRSQFRKMFRLRRDMRDILLADEFDAAAFDATIREMETAGLEATASVFTVVRRIGLELPAEQRRKFFEVVFSRDNRGPMPGGRPPHDRFPKDRPFPPGERPFDEPAEDESSGDEPPEG